MFLYLAAFSVVTVLVFIYQTIRRSQAKAWILLVLAWLILLGLSSLRVNVGTDYPNYVDLYYRISLGLKTHFEPGFVWLNQLSLWLFNSPQGVFFLSAAAYLTCVGAGILKQSKKLWLSVALFCILPFYLYSFNAVRQTIAIGIVFASGWYLISGKFWRYAAMVVVASVLFHKTALLMLPFYFLLRFNYHRYGYGLIVLLAGGLTLMRQTLIQALLNFYPIYKDQLEMLNEGVSEIFIGLGLFGLLLIGYLLITKSVNTKQINQRVYINAIFFVILMHGLLFWMPGAFRLYAYVDIFLIVALPNLLSQISDRQIQLALVGSLMLMILIYFSVSVGLNNSNDVLPYRTIFTDTIKSRDPVLQKHIEWGLGDAY